MYARFTDRARKVMLYANEEAERNNHEYINTEHILVGLMKEGSGIAVNILKNSDLDVRKVRLEIEKISKKELETIPQKQSLSHSTKKVIEYAMDESRAFRHNYVGTEHLALGLIREQKGIAAQVLKSLGVNYEDFREEVVTLIGFGIEPL